jgi:hypothetical protein
VTRNLSADVLIVGAGVGGCAAALAATALGYHVVLTEPTDWIGGQLTSQGVPPDEHPWIEDVGCTQRYRAWRNGVRTYYRQHFRLAPQARAATHLNPGGGWVSALCCRPRVALAVLHSLLDHAVQGGLLQILLRHTCHAVEMQGDVAQAATVRHRDSNDECTISAAYIIDATELGDVLPLAGVEYVTGAEGQSDTNEPHAAATAQPNNVQGFTWCFAMGFDAACSDDRYVIEQPAQYEFWRSYVPSLSPAYPGPLLSFTYANPINLQPRTLPLFATQSNQLDWFGYRQMVSQAHEPHAPHNVTLVNWPQNDYWLGNVIDAPAYEAQKHWAAAKQLSLAWLYWLQTEAGLRGLHLCPGLLGTPDGFALAPYFREARRIKAKVTVTENHVATQARRGWPAAPFADSVGIGYYRIDLHPSTGGDNYIDIASQPFQIPLGALIPIRVENVLPACKNIGTTHITNGCYRLHPVEWNIGEAAGTLAAFCLQRQVLPRQVHANAALLADLQTLLVQQGVELRWPASVIRTAANQNTP